MKNRILINSGSALTDLTTNLDNYYGDTSTINLTTSAAIYIGQPYPFNHLYFKVSTVNQIAATLTLKVWDGSTWASVAELLDETSAFTESGYMTWIPDKNEVWQREDTVDSNDTEIVTGLGDKTIYDKYWIKITTDTNITATTALQWVGNLFGKEDDIEGSYPSLAQSTYKTAWEAGKTDWEEQRYIASRSLLHDLINKRIIKNSAQVLDRQIFIPACTHKTAEIIFTGLGSDYEDDRILAGTNYRNSLKLDIYNKDENNNARLDPSERKSRQGMLTR